MGAHLPVIMAENPSIIGETHRFIHNLGITSRRRLP
jgi:hypothetical protein